MEKPYGFGEINIDIRTGRDLPHGKAGPETPFRILILGDFSGRTSRGQLETGTALADRRPQLVDRDNFDDVLRKCSVHLSVPLDEQRFSLWFADIDDFHPDRLYERVPIFQKLREVRKKLSDPSTFREASAELGISTGGENPPPSATPPSSEPAPDASTIASGSLLEDAIRSTEGLRGGEAPSRVPSKLTSFLNKAVAPHLVAKTDPKQPELIGLIDEALTAQMRALLHLPDFQALEAAWRALFFLIRRIETDANLKLYLLDISKQELAADLSAARDLTTTGIYKLLVEQTVRMPGAEPWAVLAGNYTFDRTAADLTLLSRLAQLAAHAGAPFIAGASPGILGCGSIQDLPQPQVWKNLDGSGETKSWDSLRSLPEASHLGLALPRFILRLPYGKETVETGSFGFEEMPASASHEDYLWGNPAFLCVCLLAQAFAAEQWEMRPGGVQEIEGLPLHISKEDGDPAAKPCAEVLMTDAAAVQILERGLMPFASFRDRDAVRLLRFQSIANPLKALAGRWG